jgi:toxin ParE1/3/4
MARVVVTLSADADIAAIQKDLAKSAGIGVATKYTAAFERVYDRLAEHPGSGAPRPALGRDIRIAVVLPYVLIYRCRAADDVATVLRIVHGRRNITAKLISD